jgi:hypothetical protein
MMLDGDCSFVVLVDSGGGGGLGKRISGLRCDDMYAKPEVGTIGNREETESDIVCSKSQGNR